jgi:hypothetical protein
MARTARPIATFRDEVWLTLGAVMQLEPAAIEGDR